ncbi:TRAP transporter permease [Azospirillum sp. SYSU D00513]|uniref:TRAP transporter permease n=1 Tax=Azospirillum sp. SYSU D00513 TaxID=2812561 RepID=UPI001A958665|nr:TRAP transporter permease [Azospirillum sp. SYSU D00513]
MAAQTDAQAGTPSGAEADAETLQHAVHQPGGQGAAGNPLHAGPPDRATGIGKVIFAIAVAFSLFQVYTASYTPLSSLVVRSLHVGFLLLLTFGLCASLRGGRGGPFWLDWALGAAGFVISLYHLYFEHDLLMRAGDPSTADILVGMAALALVFEAARRMMGLALPIICALFLAYGLFGEYLPAPLDHRGYGFDQVIDQMFLGTEGIYGTPTFVSSTYIFLFILFGSFLERAGMIGLFTDVAMGTVGHQRGGPAKVAVVSSALMGTINGSGVANVVTTGQFTIPLMKRFGYRPAFAGGVEATASMGGQIMPPVMGAVAFIMAETINVPYSEIVKAAIIPAILYFATVLWMVHLEAGRLGLMGLPKEDCPSPLKAIREKWYLVLPLAVLVWLLFSGYTPLFAGTVGLGLTVLIVLGSSVTALLGPMALRMLFWVALGFAASAFFEYGITAVYALIAALIAVNLFTRGGRATLDLALQSLADGARHALSVGVACALVGVIIGTMTLTGLGSNFVRVIVSIGEGSLFLSLVLTMLTCLVLGMGIPTIPNYIITSSLVGPALLDLGVPLIVSHMFVFYFGIMADLTPPVALAAFAAAPIARASGLKIGLQCLRIAIAGFVVPFMAVYAPSLMLQAGDLTDTAYVTVKALISIGLWGAASIGYLRGRLTVIERLWATAAAFLLVVALPITDEIGLALSAAFIAFHWWRTRRLPAGAPADRAA